MLYFSVSTYSTNQNHPAAVHPFSIKTAAILPVCPLSPLCEKNISFLQQVHMEARLILSFGTPISINSIVFACHRSILYLFCFLPFFIIYRCFGKAAANCSITGMSTSKQQGPIDGPIPTKQSSGRVPKAFSIIAKVFAPILATVLQPAWLTAMAG